jgi:hypothetical protein
LHLTLAQRQKDHLEPDLMNGIAMAAVACIWRDDVR